VLPGFTGTVTQVRGVAASTFELNPLFQTFFQRTRALNTGLEHRRGRWELDADASYSRTYNNLGAGYKGPGGSLVARVAGVGWTLDNSDPAAPRFLQTEGPSIFDLANYTSAVQHTVRNDKRNAEVFNAKANAAWRAPTEFPLQLKAGGFFRHHYVEEVNGTSRWNRTAGAPPLPAGTPDATSQEVRMGRDLPFPEPSVIFPQLGNPALWTEDVYYREVQRLSLTTNATEDIAAGYVRAQAKWGRVGAIAGVRSERTEVKGEGRIRVRPATAAQIPDPVKRAAYDWDHPVTNRGSYTRSFPSLHLTGDVAANLKARGSWSTSFGRPAFSSLIPSATINDAAQTVTINNPGLGPQYARNLDLSLEYYFKPAGFVSVGWFRKSIRDYILTTDTGVVGTGNDNGYEGNYVGYSLLSQRNAGSAQISGWEFDWRQQFTFLPGLLRGLSASANYTSLQTEGDFGGTAIRRTGEVAGFVPRTGNASLSYNYRGFGARVLVSYTGTYLNSYAEATQRRVYVARRVITNVGLSWQVRPQATLFLDVSNIFNEPQERYRYVPAMPAYLSTTGPALTVGVSGRF
jgi:TonB-dependent receptor